MLVRGDNGKHNGVGLVEISIISVMQDDDSYRTAQVDGVQSGLVQY